MGAEFKRLFADTPINKSLTIEASGIGIACMAYLPFNNAPVVFAKKAQSINLDGEMYRRIQAFYGKVFDVIVSKFIGPDDHVLIIDDFGERLRSMACSRLSKRLALRLKGIGIAVEGLQPGGASLRSA